MKKLNKIISIFPIMGSSILIPAAISSCSKTEEVIEMHNLLPSQPYKPKTSQHDKDYWNQTEATVNYIKAVKENPQIFEDDACLAAQNMIKKNPISGLTEFSFGVSKPKFGTTHIWQYGSEDFEYSTITAMQKLHFQAVYYPNDGVQKTVWNLDIKIWYDNVVFYAFEDVNEENNSVWNLGLFDFNIDEEAYWPFISNTEAWSIKYSCASERSTYFVDGDGNESLLNNQSSYYSGHINNGKTLMDVIEYYIGLPEENLEKQIISIILFDYESYYLAKVSNIPEVRLSSILSSDYSIATGGIDVLLKGLVFIRPIYLEKEWVESGDFIIEVETSPQLWPYTHNSDDVVPSKRVIVFPWTSGSTLTFGDPRTDYRYNVLIPCKLNSAWKMQDFEEGTTFPIQNVVFNGESQVLKIRMYPKEGSEAAEVITAWTKDNPLTQSVYLTYDYVLQNIDL